MLGGIVLLIETSLQEEGVEEAQETKETSHVLESWRLRITKCSPKVVEMELCMCVCWGEGEGWEQDWKEQVDCDHQSCLKEA